uniref:4'-phosphopantetheinyl transferase N-terminal domain-containing protein n=1 Tax=Accipiter nisus TaxID=211598 RepID=A0A8B9NFU0_9AVES
VILPRGSRRCRGAMGSVRWAFPCAAWRPSRQEWLLAARLVQPEEKDRVGQFVFARDAKAALVHAGGGAGGTAAGGRSLPAGLAGPPCPSPLSRCSLSRCCGRR